MQPKKVDQPNRQRSWAALFSILAAVVLLYLALQGIDWGTFWDTLRYGHYEILLLTMPIASLGYIIRALRWSVLVRVEQSVPVRLIFWANMVGYLGNAYLPARAGELLRSGFLGRKTGLGMSFLLATALSERILDTLALVLIGSVALLLQANISSVLGEAVRMMALAGIVGLAVILAAPFQEQVLLRVLRRIPLPAGINDKIAKQISRFLVGMRSLHNVRRLVTFLLLTAIIWLIDGIANMIGAHIVGQTLDLGQALILLSALGLSSAIPSTPGSLGVYQIVAVIVLTPFGFSRAEALAFILISQVSTYLTVTFWGLLGLWRIGRMSNPQSTPVE